MGIGGGDRRNRRTGKDSSTDEAFSRAVRRSRQQKPWISIKKGHMTKEDRAEAEMAAFGYPPVAERDMEGSSAPKQSRMEKDKGNQNKR